MMEEELRKMRERLMDNVHNLGNERDTVCRRLDQIDAEMQGLRYAVDLLDGVSTQLEKKVKDVDREMVG